MRAVGCGEKMVEGEDRLTEIGGQFPFTVAEDGGGKKIVEV